jgi:hypothetical protein
VSSVIQLHESVNHAYQYGFRSGISPPGFNLILHSFQKSSRVPGWQPYFPVQTFGFTENQLRYQLAVVILRQHLWVSLSLLRRRLRISLSLPGDSCSIV